MRLRFFFAWLCATLFLATLLPATALAQTVTIGTPIEHSIEPDIEGELTEILYDECVGDGTITIPFTLTNPGDYDVWVWSGVTSCENDDTRADNLGSRCRDLGRLDDERNATLRVRDVLSSALTGGETDVCASLTNGGVSVFIMLMDGPTKVINAAKVDLDFDFEGPSPPELKSVGIGENQLFAKWDASSSSDIDGYYVFCEPVPAPGSLVPSTGGTTSTGGRTSTGGTPSAGGTAASNDAGATAQAGDSSVGGDSGDNAGGDGAGNDPTVAGATSTGGSSTTAGATSTGGSSTATGGRTSGGSSGSTGTGASSGSTGSTGTGTCRTSLLEAGERPPTPGGTVSRSSKVGRAATAGGSADSLENNVAYACGVSGVDSKGNLGPLSEIKCATPEIVTDFFEAYDRAGGRGGGGFCAFGPPRGNHAFVVAGLGAALLAARRKQRNRRS